ncbi:MAG: P1 family peptidase [Thermoplasmata archaeon]|nr:P1 family peptidase [Thermoplasmata archaeon]
MSAEPPTATRVPGVRVGQATDATGRTGVTVLRFDAAAPTVLDVRGGAAATYDTASLGLDSTFGRRWALFFSGGSVFGLDAAAGVRARILEEGGGHRAFANPHRIVPISGAALFDLPAKLGPLPDYRALGYDAARAASRSPVAMGRTGAGAGATVGKYRGREFASLGGVGSSSVRLRGLATVGALVVLNSVGAIRDPEDGSWKAGARHAGGPIEPPQPLTFRRRRPRRVPVPRGTNLVAVVTDAPLTRPELARVAILAHTGIARSVVPVNSATDGDVVFATSTREPTAPDGAGARADSIGVAAAHAVVEAVLAAVRPG